jgi:hypothetical protein
MNKSDEDDDNNNSNNNNNNNNKVASTLGLLHMAADENFSV